MIAYTAAAYIYFDRTSKFTRLSLGSTSTIRASGSLENMNEYCVHNCTRKHTNTDDSLEPHEIRLCNSKMHMYTRHTDSTLSSPFVRWIKIFVGRISVMQTEADKSFSIDTFVNWVLRFGRHAAALLYLFHISLHSIFGPNGLTRPSLFFKIRRETEWFGLTCVCVCEYLLISNGKMHEKS